MWEYEHSVRTSAAPEAVWRRWTDMASWPEWNDGVATISVDGPFAAGTRFTMTPPGDEPISMRLTEVVPLEVFSDQMDGGDFLVTTEHRLIPEAGGTRILYRTEITGPGADVVAPSLGPAITADFPDVLATLAAKAEAE